MNHLKPLLKRLLILLVLLSTLIPCCFGVFDDIPESKWYHDSVEYVYMNGLFKGTSLTEFSPKETMTRGMFVTVLYRMSRTMEEDFSNPGFVDLNLNAYYATPVFWATEKGIVNGHNPWRFAPNDPVTREQICKLICTYCDYMGFTLPTVTEATAFADAEDISPYAREYVTACQQAGIINGYSGGDFRPKENANRAHVAVMLHRLSLLMEEEGYIIGPGNPTADWRMILVNRWNPMPEGYVNGLSLSYVNYYEQVDSRILSDFNAMTAAMKAAGLSPYINSGFRTHATQQYLYNRKINQYLSYGYSYADAELLAQKWVAVPGTSEHELGLALDFNMDMWNSTAVHTWLKNNAHNYGFIYRYQPEKTDITGINPEAWHYRYVGRDNAIRITESGLCLEEYTERFS